MVSDFTFDKIITMKVLTDFTCKVTRKRYLKGEEYTGDRAAELSKRGLVSEPEKKSNAGPPAKEKVEHQNKKEKVKK